MFNPMNHASTSQEYITQNMSNYCSLIGNADPQCFCGNNIDTCMQMTLGPNYENLKSTSPVDYENIKANCGCFNNQCNFWASNGNTYAKSVIKGCNNSNMKACGSTFSPSYQYGVTAQNKTLQTVCGINTEPTENTEPSANTPSANTPPSTDIQKPPMSASEKVGISLVVILLIFIVMYYYMLG